VKFGVIVDVEASRAIRQAEVGAAKTMIERTEERFGLVFSARARFNLNSRPFSGAAAIIPVFAMTAAAVELSVGS
jgi:hypothetical protein